MSHYSHSDIHAILSPYDLPTTYHATIETDTGPDPEGAPTMISDLEARKIASEWHGGGGTALYAFTSTGAIDTGNKLVNEIHGNVNGIQVRLNDQGYTAKGQSMMLYIEIEPLMQLLEYVTHHGTRGPQPGWNDLTW
jgi:hypothetical protein